MAVVDKLVVSDVFNWLDAAEQTYRAGTLMVLDTLLKPV
jgi:hypothetical protein